MRDKTLPPISEYEIDFINKSKKKCCGYNITCDIDSSNLHFINKKFFTGSIYSCYPYGIHWPFDFVLLNFSSN